MPALLIVISLSFILVKMTKLLQLYIGFLRYKKHPVL